MILDNLRGSWGCATFSNSRYPTVKTIMGADIGSTQSVIYNLLSSADKLSIVVGRGTDPVARSDYKLVDQITTGILESNKSIFYENGNTKSITIYRFSAVIENTSSEAITINEIGLMSVSGTDSSKYVLLIRENVDPYILMPNESVQITIAIE